MRNPMMLALTLLLPTMALGQSPQGEPVAPPRAEAPMAQTGQAQGQDLMSLVMRWQQAKRSGDAAALSSVETQLLDFAPRNQLGANTRTGPPMNGGQQARGQGAPRGAGQTAQVGGAPMTVGVGGHPGNAQGPAKGAQPQSQHNAVPIGGAEQGVMMSAEEKAGFDKRRTADIKTQLQALQGNSQLSQEDQGKKQALERELAELTNKSTAKGQQGKGPDKSQIRR